MPATRRSVRVRNTTGDGLPVRIRKATEHDLDEIRRLDAEAFPGDPYPYFVLRQYVDAFADGFLVLEEDGGRGLCGYVLATPAHQGVSWVFSLCVTPRMRRRGLGRWLMTELLGRLRAAGARTVRLSVEPGNRPAVLLYGELGFTSAGGCHRDYFGPGEHRLLMTRVL
ncbi:GNAT family N-acetyltransferase [Streptomyces sp. NPDC004065]|uniref:GNAT family N-acetyltransferase n=1 Tax=Streptomyces sp. NPDC004065 TaxID=3364689 RepID=UPI00384CE7E9